MTDKSKPSVSSTPVVPKDPRERAIVEAAVDETVTNIVDEKEEEIDRIKRTNQADVRYERKRAHMLLWPCMFLAFCLGFCIAFFIWH